MHNTNKTFSVKLVNIIVRLAYKKGRGGDNHVFVPQATVVQFIPSHKRHYVDQRDRKLE